MKFLNTFLTVVSVVLLSVVGSMAQTSDQVITAIQSFIGAARTLDIQVTSLTVINFPTEGFIIASGLNNITEDVNALNSEFLPTTPPYPDDAAVMVVDVLTAFVAVYEALLSDIKAKEPLAAMFGVTAPIAAALRDLAMAVETFAFDLIDLIPTEAEAATVLLNQLIGNLTLVITTFDS